MAAGEVCENCRIEIGEGGSHLWDQGVVCEVCYGRLMQMKRAGTKAPTPVMETVRRCGRLARGLRKFAIACAQDATGAGAEATAVLARAISRTISSFRRWFTARAL